MSIASRITAMEQHITNAYDGLEDLGIDLTDVDKNIDNISSMLENVWDEYPKVTVTDVEETMLEGTKAGRMEIDLEGQTEQTQLNGKNLFDNSIINNTWVGTTGNIYTDGNSSSFRYDCEAGKSFTLSATFESVLFENIVMLAFYDNNDNLLLRQVDNNKKDTIVSATAPENTAYMYAGHYKIIPLQIQLEERKYSNIIRTILWRNTSTKSTDMKYLFKMYQEVIILRYKIRIYLVLYGNRVQSM